MNSLLKFAVIGNGFIAPKHFEAIKAVGGELAAVCDINPEKRVDAVPFFTDYKEALDGVDAVSICTPNDTHTEIALEAARRGLRVLCEKPVTFNENEFALMKGVPNLFGNFQLRYLPEISEMRELAKTAKHVSLVVEMKRSHTYHKTWKGQPERTGGLLVNIGCHYFDLIGHLFGYHSFESITLTHTETLAQGVLAYIDGPTVNWRIELTDEKPEYERSLTIGDRKFDLVQKENLHIKTYENFMWGQGIPVSEEEKIIKMIHAI